MIRTSLLLMTLLLALSGIAAAQATVAPANRPGAGVRQARTAAAPAPETKNEAGVPGAHARLSPQQQRLLADADQLLTLAQQLKGEVDKTDQYTLSLTTVRRAEDIEKLAGNLQKQFHDSSR